MDASRPDLFRLPREIDAFEAFLTHLEQKRRTVTRSRLIDIVDPDAVDRKPALLRQPATFATGTGQPCTNEQLGHGYRFGHQLDRWDIGIAQSLLDRRVSREERVGSARRFFSGAFTMRKRGDFAGQKLLGGAKLLPGTSADLRDLVIWNEGVEL